MVKDTFHVDKYDEITDFNKHDDDIIKEGKFDHPYDSCIA